MNWLNITSALGILSLLGGTSLAFFNVKEKVAVHENRITTIEKIVEKQDSQNAEILKLLKTLVDSKSLTTKIASSTPVQ